MRKCARWMIGIALAGAPAATSAQIIYSQDFEPPVPASSTASTFGGFGQIDNVSGTSWQVQGGGGGNGISVTAGVDTNGVGGSQALFADWDHSNAASFTFNQITIYGIPGPGAGNPASLVQVSMDLFISGSESSNTPVAIAIQQGANDLTFTPTLSNGAFTSVSFTLDQASNGNLWDPTQAFNIRLQHGAGGFGFDAGNIVRVDNIVVQSIPEPSALMLAAIGGLAVLRRRRA